MLDPLFAYEPGSIRIDDGIAACATEVCPPEKESAIFASASAAPPLTDAVDDGDQHVANARLDVPPASVVAVVFFARLQ